MLRSPIVKNMNFCFLASIALSSTGSATVWIYRRNSKRAHRMRFFALADRAVCDNGSVSHKSRLSRLLMVGCIVEKFVKAGLVY